VDLHASMLLAPVIILALLVGKPDGFLARQCWLFD